MNWPCISWEQIHGVDHGRMGMAESMDEQEWTWEMDMAGVGPLPQTHPLQPMGTRLSASVGTEH